LTHSAILITVYELPLLPNNTAVNHFSQIRSSSKF